MRFDRVVSRLPEGIEHVCTLVLRDVGLYVLHAGNVEDLPGYLPNQTDGAGLAKIEKSAHRIEQMRLGELVVEAHSAFIYASDIRDVQLRTETLSPNAAVPVIQFQTSINQYTFLFLYASLERVQDFHDALKQAVKAVQ